jgi:hypothetical protein
MRCVLCGRERESGTTVQLTEDERKILGSEATEVFYCTPCHGVVTDKEMGARFLSSRFALQAKLMGHPKAEEMGERMYKFLIERATKNRVS